MKARLTVTAEIDTPTAGAAHMLLACLSYIKEMGVKQVQVNADGDVVVTQGTDKQYAVEANQLPRIPYIIPHVETAA